MSNSWRVELLEDRVRFDTFGADGVSPPTQYVDTVADLPEWVQGKLAVLSILQTHTDVDGVGSKVSERIFWIDK